MMTDSSGPTQRPLRIALIGMRGAGKTTVGRLLATQLGGEFVDTDELVVAAAGRSIADIFATDGEPAFREMERKAIAEAVTGTARVISVGGGAVLDESNVRRLESAATIIWLTAPPDVLWNRINADDATTEYRPALTDEPGLHEMRRLAGERNSLYEAAADVVIDTDGLAVEQVTARVVDETSG